MLDKDNLYHHGIKGQRWGIRRFQKKDGSLTSRGAQRYETPQHSDYTSAHTKRQINSMSDAELRRITNRLQNEQQYRQLTTPQSKSRFEAVMGTIKKVSDTIGAVNNLYKNSNTLVKNGKEIYGKFFNSD